MSPEGAALGVRAEPPSDDRSDPTVGLDAAAVADRRASGLTNDVPRTTTRSVREIVRANVLTRFNLLLGSMLVVILVVGPLQDALFGFVLVANALIGIVQEVRAKRALDRLTLMTARTTRVVRDGAVETVPVEQIVLDDVIDLSPGEQVPVDATVATTEDLEVDESLVTGESEAIAKARGDELLSGSVVLAGRGRCWATRVGSEAYAAALAAEAQRFSLARSELRTGIDWFVGLVTWLLLPTAGLLLWSQIRAEASIAAALRGAVAGTVAMVPEGLVLLTSVAFAVSVVRLSRRDVLVQELPAVETLARVDVVVFDKTGTITAGLAVERIVPLVEDLDPAAPLGALAAAEPNPNSTLRVIGEGRPPPEGWKVVDAVPFSSARKWSAVDCGPDGTWVLGAPDVLLGDKADGGSPHADILHEVEALAAAGRRVLLLARADGLPGSDGPPRNLVAAALVVMGEAIRSDAAPTIAYFHEQGVATKVVSGDHPATVAAIAERVGISGGPAVDARHPPAPGGTAELIADHDVFGRVVPEEKRDLVRALSDRDHVIAVTGDGVNDILALKEADIGVAMGTGSEATRAVSQLVLVDDRFANLPHVVAEGRRVIGNIERVARLFLTKTVYAAVMTVTVGVLGVAFPFLPRHLTLIGSLTIGIPAFFLALEPETHRARTGFLRRVLAFAVPVGTAAAAATLASYLLAVESGADIVEARTTATLTLAVVGLFVLRLLAPPVTRLRRVVLASMTAALGAVLVVPALRDFFALDLAAPAVSLAALGIACLTALVMQVADRTVGEVARRWLA